MPEHVKCLVVRSGKSSDGDADADPQGRASIESLTAPQLFESFYQFEDEGIFIDGVVELDVEYSSLNFKDALCASGHPGVAKSLPMIPGIDAAGTVVGGNSEEFPAGAKVIAGHLQFGTEFDGGFCRRVRVPAACCVRLPDGMTTRLAMIYGTAGFTAAQSVERIVSAGVTASADTSVIVTGATGGVGTMAVMMLDSLGFSITAVTGKSDRHDWLKDLGATFVIGRDQMPSAEKRPLNSGKYAAAVDTVGGDMLASVLSIMRNRGVVTACGMVGGVALNTSVYPFILRGVTLHGIDSANINRTERRRIWEKIAGDFRVDDVERIVDEIKLDQLPDRIEAILNGRVAGRVVVNLHD